MYFHLLIQPVYGFSTFIVASKTNLAAEINASALCQLCRLEIQVRMKASTSQVLIWRLRWEFNSWLGKIPWRTAWQPTPGFLPGESPWTEDPDGLQSMGSKRLSRGLSDWKHSFLFLFSPLLCFLFTPPLPYLLKST